MASLAFVPRKLRAKASSSAGIRSSTNTGLGQPQAGASGTPQKALAAHGVGLGGGSPERGPSSSSRTPSGLILRVWVGAGLDVSKAAGRSEADIAATITSAAERLLGHSVAYVDLESDVKGKAKEGHEWVHLRCQSSASALKLVGALNEKPGTLRASLMKLATRLDDVSPSDQRQPPPPPPPPPPVVAVKLGRVEEQEYWSPLPARAKRAAVKKRRAAPTVEGVGAVERRKKRARKSRVKRRRRERNEERATRQRRRALDTQSAMDVG